MLRSIEWPTLGLLAACYGLWTSALMGAELLGSWITLPLLILVIALHSSLQHEAIHGHPTRNPIVNAILVFPALGLFVPYHRFHATHLAHHHDADLTDPYNDPESNYLDPKVWRDLPPIVRAVLYANNTLLGRMLLGPALGLGRFYRQDLAAAWRGDRAVRRAWALHILALAPVVILLGATGKVSALSYLAAAYAGFSVLQIRTYLEHRAHASLTARSVVIEDRGPLALIFLNNNLHAVHHAYPTAPWYRLPAIYRAQKERILALNDGYAYRSYGEIFARHFLRAKDPVPHPLWPGDPACSSSPAPPAAAR